MSTGPDCDQTRGHEVLNSLVRVREPDSKITIRKLNLIHSRPLLLLFNKKYKKSQSVLKRICSQQV